MDDFDSGMRVGIFIGFIIGFLMASAWWYHMAVQAGAI